jgi:hypothetical protein
VSGSGAAHGSAALQGALSSSWLHLSQTVSFLVWFLRRRIDWRRPPGSRFGKRPRRALAALSSGCPLGEYAPVGCRHVKPKCQRCPKARRPRPRLCLRRGCGRKYQPRLWNQRYCQEPECRRLLRRWQAAQRQAQRRLDATAKAQHAEAERARRQRARALPQPAPAPADAAARGHAAKIIWPSPCCGRPGCHQPPMMSVRNPARFCSLACRQAMRRVVDRERKWRWRGTFKGRRQRLREYARARARRCQQQHDHASASASRPPPP